MGDLIERVKSLIGGIIQRPKMSDKLLSKPPFRFLHDTITGVCKATNFAQGLVPEELQDSSAISDKQSKIQYLELYFNMVGICKGYQLEARGGKVVAGLEPEKTNAFLIALAECATDSNIDSEQAVSRTLAGETPGSGPAAIKGGFDAKNDSESKGGSPMVDRNNSDNSGGDDMKGFDNRADAKGLDEGMPAVTGPPAGFGMDPNANLERGKSRSGTRGSKPNRESGAAAAGLSGFDASPKLDKEIEACDGSEELTKTMVGALISRPKLTDKLLAKPPFRFLHDLVMEMVNATGFATYLYDAHEADSAQVNDKEKKIAFLEKIIKVVGVSLNTIVEARPAKIVAGMEPANTNVFLQLLAVAAKHIPDSYDSVKTIREQLGEQMPERVSAPEPSGGGGGGNDFRADSKSSMASPEPERRVIGAADSKADSKGGDDDGDPDAPRSMRPTTARRRPPKVKDGAREMTAKDTAPTTKKTEGIMIDGAADDDDDDDELVEADSKRLGSMPGMGNTEAKKAGEGESKLVQDIMARQAEAAAAEAGEVVEEKEEIKEEKSEQQGSGIRLGARLGRKSTRKSVTGASGNATTPSKGGVSTSSGSGGGSYTAQDINRLRSAIQVLVQHTGPLGTCMDFIQEDIGLMSSELHRWEEESRKYEAEVEEERRKSDDMLRPLTLELRDLEEQVGESISKISALKAQIAKNETKTQQILKLVATA